MTASNVERMRELEKAARIQKWGRIGRCKIWKGRKTPFGYGVVAYNKRTTSAHRAMWQQRFGPLERNQLVCHKCDNPACVRISHLFVGSHADNMRDMVDKFRYSKTKTESQKLSAKSLMKSMIEKQSGRRKPWTRLTNRQVIAIFKSDDSQREIAKKFGISQPLVSQVKLKKIHAHITNSLKIEGL